ncbi:MAG: tagaturonate epimerase family protein [bacterium]
MIDLNQYVRTLPGVYPASINQVGRLFVLMVREANADFVIAFGPGSEEFSGNPFSFKGENGVKTTLSHATAILLRRLFPFTAPVPVLKYPRTFGVGDRLGIATSGHIRVFRDYDAKPVFAQQSIRELSLTNRTYADVLDAVTFAVFRDGYRGGFGADGDHLKKAAEIEYALSEGYTMITLDCSEHIDNGAATMTDADIDATVILPDELATFYLKKSFHVEGELIRFDGTALKRAYRIYGNAIEFAAEMYETYFANGKSTSDFEMSIDETATPTTPEQHYFVAKELIRRDVRLATLAPRFCGEFQKGVDYAGNLADFERELKIHAAIARRFGYKLSIHSGSDKFSVFALIGKYTNGNFHVKTAGTNWLEAMKVVAAVDPTLYREIHVFALAVFPEAKKFYHVTTDLSRIPALMELSDADLPGLFTQNDARQLIHITYGFILNAKNADGSSRFKDRLYRLWRNHDVEYSDALYGHIGKHLSLLYSGFRN